MKKLLFFCIALLLASCQQEPQEMHQQPTRHSVHKNGKPGAEVALLSPLKVDLLAGTATDIELLLNAKIKQGDTMHVELNPGAGLQLLDGQGAHDFTGNELDQYPIVVRLYAANEGRYYLNLVVSIGSGDTLSSRTLALIVQVGADSSEKLSAKGLKKVSPEGVIRLPAQEQIINQ